MRNLETLTLEPSRHLNIFTGKNASGKTAILESIFLLSRAKSFRTPRIQDVIQQGEKSLSITAKLSHELQGEIKTGIEKQYGQVTIKRNGEKIKTVSDQAKTLPIIVITQDTQTLLTGTPKNRRHWLDWAMFHVEPAYLELWKANMRALRHRNALLKQREKNRKNYRGWEQAMVESADLITLQRQYFLEGMLRVIQTMAGVEAVNNIQATLSRGWPQEKDYQTTLEENWKGDLERGFTRAGAHQADIQFKFNNQNVAAQYSRGQLKILANFLLFAQAKMIANRTGIKPIIINDDFQAELDEEGCEHILTWLKNESFQCFLSTTAISPGQEQIRQFHVKQGKIS